MKMLRISVACVLLLACASLWAGGTGEPTKPETTAPAKPAQQPAAQAQGYKEAPSLADMVKQGKLPPIEQRLPQTPVTVKPLQSVGKFGGTIRMAFTGVNDWWNLALFGARGEPLVQANADGQILPNLLESWEYLNDGATLRLHLRKGIRWSDGAPLTVDDIIYDLQTRVEKNMALEKAGLASKVVVEGMKRLDDWTVDLPLNAKYPLEFTLAYDPTVSPKHYLSKFDPRYDSTKTWQDLTRVWSASRNSDALVGLPVLSPWKVTEFTDAQIVAERNPYFWKVDTAGQQR